MSTEPSEPPASEKAPEKKICPYDSSAIRGTLDGAVAKVMEELGHHEDFAEWDKRLAIHTVCSLFSLSGCLVSYLYEGERFYSSILISLFCVMSVISSYIYPLSSNDSIFTSKKPYATLKQEFKQSICNYFTEEGEFLYETFKTDVVSVVEVLTAKKEKASTTTEAASPSSPKPLPANSNMTKRKKKV